MEQRVLRVLALGGSCFAFGAMVWMLSVNNSQPRSLVAATSQSTQASPAFVGHCASGQILEIRIDDKKGELTTREVGKVAPYMCKEIVMIGDTKSCETTRCCRPGSSCDPSNSFCPIVQEGQSIESVCASIPWGQGGSVSGGNVYSVAAAEQAFSRVLAVNDAPEIIQGCQDCNEKIAAALQPPPVAPVTIDSPPPIEYTPESSTPLPPTQQPSPTQPVGSEAVLSPTAGGSGPDTQGGINTIAGGGSGNTSGNSSETNKPTFSLSQSLSNGGAFNLGSLFSGLGSGSRGENYSGGGTMAYAPTGPSVYNNKNFDAVSSQVNFPQPRVTAADLIAEIGRKNPPPQVTASDLADKTFAGKIADTAREIGGTLFKPVGDLFEATFSPTTEEESVLPDEKAETGKPKQVDFEKQGLELDVLELLLVPGDPREIWDGIAENIENASRVANPFLDGALVRTEPWANARRTMEGGVVKARRGSPDLSGGAFPAPFSGDLSQGTQEAIRDAMESSKSRSAVSAMRLTVKTISTAVTDLFKNIAASLFWWL